MTTAKSKSQSSQAIRTLEDPPVARALFGEPRWAWIWLIVRLYAGYEWISAGYEKLTGTGWIGAQAE